jgi:hypothetical protein
VEADERSDGKMARKPGNRNPDRIAWEGYFHGTSRSAKAEHLPMQSEELAIATGRAVVWVIVMLEFKRYPRAEGVSDAMNLGHPSMRIARGEGSRSGVACRSKGTA